MTDHQPQAFSQSGEDEISETIQAAAGPLPSNAKKFLETFNKIEHVLHDLYGSTRYVGFKRMVETLSKEDSLIAQYAIDLIEYLQLRNAIVHKSTGESIAEPHDDVIVGITRLYEQLSHPPTAADLASTPVDICQTTDALEKVVIRMRQHFFSMVPVYHDNRFVGVLSDHSLVSWLGQLSPGKNFNLQDYTVASLQEYFGHEDDKHTGFRFISPQTDIYTVRDFFLSFTSEKKRLGAVFLTKSGTSMGEIEGIITAWDMWKIIDLEQQKAREYAR